MEIIDELNRKLEELTSARDSADEEIRALKSRRSWLKRNSQKLDSRAWNCLFENADYELRNRMNEIQNHEIEILENENQNLKNENQNPDFENAD